MPIDPLTIIMVLVLAVLIFFTFRNGRKRSRDMAAMQDRTRVGAEIMTNFGLFGTIVAIDDEENQVQVETSPGTILTVHRQTIAKIITPDEVVSDDEAEAVEEGEIESAEELAAREPQFGERVDGTPAESNAQKKADD
ncbi:preprotein translocase subunit YajC [Amnibacterium flavum]|uniref:preprotein translocase subunit YajC n=1 Tax=Amnibacterium flavum TaxID=2173173 RepID=UPI001057667B|nr:preprotein translocase subunit YajC [Amnibacterium flavum]